MIKGLQFKNITMAWDDAHHFSPAPRHRRRLIRREIKKLEFETCLDAGCAQPFLLLYLYNQGKKVFGCDISDKVVAANRQLFPEAAFEEVDVSRAVYPGGKKFDLVISAEVLEHIKDWQTAVRHLCLMSRRYLLITVPSGKRYKIDNLVGHFRHYAGPELAAEIEKHDFRVIFQKYWGFPMHLLYKCLINSIAPGKIYSAYGTGRYGWFEKMVSQIIYLLFFVNDCFGFGQQLILLAERR